MVAGVIQTEQPSSSLMNEPTAAISTTNHHLHSLRLSVRHYCYSATKIGLFFLRPIGLLLKQCTAAADLLCSVWSPSWSFKSCVAAVPVWRLRFWADACWW
uniref:Uncharacterized protein n=1 Tax=Arundo donax TaxID=35708 RepID=A0A0A9TBR5_ARUDO